MSLPTSAAVAEQYRAAMLRYLRRLTGDGALAEDLTQETFVRVHLHLADLRDPAALEGWLYRVATNVCMEYWRVRQRPLEFQDALAHESGCAEPGEARLRPDQLTDQGAMSACVQRFLSGLPASYRSVLLLHDLQGYRDPEIAAQLGESLATVKVRLHRARTRLKAVLSMGCEFTQDERGVRLCHPRTPVAAN